MNGSTNIQTAVRIRPYISWEKRANIKPLWQVKENSIVQILDESFTGESYTFDHIFEENKTNQDVYSEVVKPLVASYLQGINATIFAYGQTSSGKTHTMLGNKGTPGIIGLAVDDVFRHMEENSTDNFILRCSYLEIYNEKINDLLHSNVTDLKIREDVNQGVHVIVKEEIIRTPEELFTLMKKGMKTRKVGSTDMNERSSRSHSIFKLVIQSQSEGLKGSYTESTLSLVDLAGSERVGQMKMGKDRQVEGVSINKSLTALGLVIRKLSEGDSFINYRDSKLTRILQHSLGGNSKTLIIATITVAVWEETKSTLDFAHRAKFVKNRPVINRRVTDKDQLREYECLCQSYKVQIDKLTVEKSDHEKKINALEGKIQCIEKFSDFEQKSTMRNQVPSRRHTFAHFELGSNRINLPFSLLSINEEWFADGEFCTPYKSRIHSNGSGTDVIDDRENVSTPNRTPPFQDLDSPKTAITRIKIEKDLAEQSYENLVLFTNLENQMKLECDEFNEIRDLCDRLRNDNLRLREDRPIIRTKIEYFYNQLSTLQTILGGSVERNSEHLYTIPEETIDFFQEDTEFTEEISNDEEKVRFKQELSEKDQMIGALKEELNNEKGRFESLLTEMNKLNEDITVKNLHIEKLNSDIKQHMKTKEAELDILNCKIEKLALYKEEMHKKLSEYRGIEDKINSTHSMQQENITLKNNLGVLERDNKTLYEKNLGLEHELHCAMLDLDEKSQLYETILKNYSEKTTLAETLEIKVRDLQSQLEDINRTLSAKVETINELERTVEQSVFRVEQAESRVSQIMQEKNKYEELQNVMANVQADNNKLLADVDNYLKQIQSLQAIVQTQTTENSTLTTKLQIKTKSFDENVVKHNKIIAELEQIRIEKESLEQRLQENMLLNSKLHGMNIRLKSDDWDKLRAERDSLEARNQQLESQVVDLEISLRKRVQLFTKLSLHLKELQNQKEASLKDERKFEPERMPQIEPVLQPKKLVSNSKQVLTMADLFGNPVNKVRVQDNSSQTEEKWQISTDNAKLEARIAECAQQLDKKCNILDKLTAALKKSKFEFKSRTLEDQIQELLLMSIKRVKPIANQEPFHTCCKTEERKSALRVSDEMRKVKERRQSTYDQRRDLSGDVERSFSLDDLDCEGCASSRKMATKLSSEITTLTDEVNNLKRENNFLDKENEDMLQIIKNYRERELESDNKCMKYEQCQKVDKETQATCNLQEKYNALKRIVRLRRRQEMNTES